MNPCTVFLPYQYTSIEGGEWLHWDINYGPVPIAKLNQRDKSFIAIGDIHVHSFHFLDKSRWDCINGWTTKIPGWAIGSGSIPPKVVDIPFEIPSSIDETLIARGQKYGKFTGHAAITQSIKSCMNTAKNWDRLTSDQKEALEMIAHKIGRILNGDPNYHDSWHDIVGYAKLVADRLIGIEK